MRVICKDLTLGPGLLMAPQVLTDVNRDLEVLAGNGLEVEVKAPLPDGSALWAYCRGASGPLSSW